MWVRGPWATLWPVCRCMPCLAAGCCEAAHGCHQRCLMAQRRHQVRAVSTGSCRSLLEQPPAQPPMHLQQTCRPLRAGVSLCPCPQAQHNQRASLCSNRQQQQQQGRSSAGVCLWLFAAVCCVLPRHKKNEVFLDVVESVNLLVNSNGTLVLSEVSVALGPWLGGVITACCAAGVWVAFLVWHTSVLVTRKAALPGCWRLAAKACLWCCSWMQSSTSLPLSACFWLPCLLLCAGHGVSKDAHVSVGHAGVQTGAQRQGG